VVFGVFRGNTGGQIKSTKGFASLSLTIHRNTGNAGQREGIQEQGREQREGEYSLEKAKCWGWTFYVWGHLT